MAGTTFDLGSSAKVAPALAEALADGQDAPIELQILLRSDLPAAERERALRRVSTRVRCLDVFPSMGMVTALASPAVVSALANDESVAWLDIESHASMHELVDAVT